MLTRERKNFKRDGKILEMYFGLGHTHRYIGRIFGLTESGVCSIIRKHALIPNNPSILVIESKLNYEELFKTFR